MVGWLASFQEKKEKERRARQAKIVPTKTDTHILFCLNSPYAAYSFSHVEEASIKSRSAFFSY